MIFRINPMPYTQGWESHRYSARSTYHHDTNSMLTIPQKGISCVNGEIDVCELFRDVTMMTDIEQNGKANYNEWNY